MSLRTTICVDNGLNEDVEVEICPVGKRKMSVPARRRDATRIEYGDLLNGEFEIIVRSVDGEVIYEGPHTSKTWIDLQITESDELNGLSMLRSVEALRGALETAARYISEVTGQDSSRVLCDYLQEEGVTLLVDEDHVDTSLTSTPTFKSQVMTGSGPSAVSITNNWFRAVSVELVVDNARRWRVVAHSGTQVHCELAPGLCRDELQSRWIRVLDAVTDRFLWSQELETLGGNTVVHISP